MIRRVAVGVGIAALVGFASWGAVQNLGAKSCTYMGCVSEIRLVATDADPAFDQGNALRFCVDDRCVDAFGNGVSTDLDLPVDGETTVHMATLEVTSADGSVRSLTWQGDATATSSKPNGDGCPPTCWYLAFRAEGDSLAPDA
jgi:hypothetical protein